MQLLRRVPFFAAIFSGLVITGLLTGSPWGRLDPGLQQRFGFALHDLTEGTWYSLFTGVLFTHRPLIFWGMLVFSAASIGVYEWLCGTRRAMLLFWVTDIGGTLIVSLGVVLPLYLLGTSLGQSLSHADDVGLSGGGFGCLGAWIWNLRSSVRWWLGGAILLLLVIHMPFETAPLGDALHALTFVVGGLLERRWSRSGTGPALADSHG